jgi:hypothetical protein
MNDAYGTDRCHDDVARSCHNCAEITGDVRTSERSFARRRTARVCVKSFGLLSSYERGGAGNETCGYNNSFFGH